MDSRQEPPTCFTKIFKQVSLTLSSLIRKRKKPIKTQAILCIFQKTVECRTDAGEAEPEEAPSKRIKLEACKEEDVSKLPNLRLDCSCFFLISMKQKGYLIEIKDGFLNGISGEPQKHPSLSACWQHYKISVVPFKRKHVPSRGSFKFQIFHG